MNLNQLTNYQLYEIIQNQKLDKLLRTAANNEFNLRKLTKDEIQEVINRHDSTIQTDKGQPLSFKYKVIALIVPFLWVIHVIMTSRYLATGQQRKSNEYWLYFCIGHLIWTIAVIILGKYLVKVG